jgi:hypothetical protein
MVRLKWAEWFVMTRLLSLFDKAGVWERVRLKCSYPDYRGRDRHAPSGDIGSVVRVCWGSVGRSAEVAVTNKADSVPRRCDDCGVRLGRSGSERVPGECLNSETSCE